MTPSEAKIAALLLSGRIISRGMMFQALYWDQADEPECAEGNLDVLLHRLRYKFMRNDIELICKWGVGYHTNPNGKQIVMIWGLSAT